jgi:hypothetical protein
LTREELCGKQKRVSKLDDLRRAEREAKQKWDEALKVEYKAKLASDKAKDEWMEASRALTEELIRTDRLSKTE